MATSLMFYYIVVTYTCRHN